MTVCDNNLVVILVSLVMPLIISVVSYFLFWRKRLNETNIQKALAIILALCVLFIFVVLGFYVSIEYGLACIDLRGMY